MLSSSRLYIAIDLGSNSFHMLVICEVVTSIQILLRIKSAKCSWQPGRISKIAYRTRPCNAEAVLEAVIRTLARHSTQANLQLPDTGDQRRGRNAADLPPRRAHHWRA